MRHQLATLATCGTLTVAGLAAGGTALAEETTCRGALGAITVDNVRVPDGARCTLTGTTVQGTIMIGTGATLVADGVSVNGNVQAEAHRRVVVRSSRVGGSIQLVQGGAADAASATLRSNHVNGDVQLFANLGVQSVSSNRVDGNLQCKENTPAPTGSDNVVGGNKEDQCSGL